jgi:hypothetical protein
MKLLMRFVEEGLATGIIVVSGRERWLKLPETTTFPVASINIWRSLAIYNEKTKKNPLQDRNPEGDAHTAKSKEEQANSLSFLFVTFTHCHH